MIVDSIANPSGAGATPYKTSEQVHLSAPATCELSICLSAEEQEERLRWAGRPRSKAEFKRSFENISVTPVSFKSLCLEMLLTEKNLQDLIGSLPENLALPFLLQCITNAFLHFWPFSS